MGLTFTACDHDDNEQWHIWKITILGQQGVYDKVVVPVGTEVQLELTIVPTFVNVVDPIWQIEDESIATVTKEGVVKALKKGETTIYVHSDYNKNVQDKITLRVIDGAIPVNTDEPVDQSEAEARRK